jgi:CHAD domain-containing protein
VPHKEQRLLQKLLKSLKRQRLENLRHLYALLKGEQYRQFKNAYQHWFAQPHYHLNAQVAFRIMVPDLLLPTLSLLLQHPGWFVGIDPHHIPYDPLPFPPLSLEILQREEPVWHDLRKKIKQFRYQLTLINPYLTASSQETLTPLIQQFKLAQEILGNLQDRSVLRDLLFTFVQTRGLNIQDLATALRILEQEYLDLWHQWQPLQKRYLNPYVRAELRQSIIELG